MDSHQSSLRLVCRSCLQRQVQECVGNSKISDGSDASFAFPRSEHGYHTFHRLALVSHPFQDLRFGRIGRAVVLPRDSDVLEAHASDNLQRQKFHVSGVLERSVGSRLSNRLVHDHGTQLAQVLVSGLRCDVWYLVLAQF